MSRTSLFFQFVVLVVLACATQVSCGRDYYEVLGLSRDATPNQIKKAYRKLSLQYHPDKNPGEENSKKFVELSAGVHITFHVYDHLLTCSLTLTAYEVLKEPDKRRVYDQYGEEGLKQQGGGAQQGFNPFGDMFGCVFMHVYICYLLITQFRFNFGGRQQQQGAGKFNMCNQTPFSYMSAAQMQKGPDLELDLEVTLRDLYLGRTFEVLLVMSTL